MTTPASRSGILAVLMPLGYDVYFGAILAGVTDAAYENGPRHARASGATVVARVQDGTLRIRVQDDGVGGARPDGHGLLGLADRLAVLGGRLLVENPADGGTLIAADVPLPA